MKNISDLIKQGGNVKKLDAKELAEEKAKLYNESEGSLKDGYDCPICKNKGYIESVRYVEMYKNYANYVRDCECMAKRKTIRKVKQSGLGEYIKFKVEDYTVTEAWQKAIKDKITNFIEKHLEDDKWFTALGSSGIGKTMGCSIIANKILFNTSKNVTYITWTDFIGQLKRDMMGDNTNVVSKYIDEIKNVDVLFMDEVLKKYNETDLKYIIEIINYRYTNNLKTLITSERELNELLDIDEATFSRVVEKSIGYIISVPKDRNKNYRLKGVIKN